MKPILLFDVEGTTTDIQFVHKVLFPYSSDRIIDYVVGHSSHPAIEIVRDTLKEEHGLNASLGDVAEALLLWIRTDRKHPALKTLQGEIWAQGYKSGAFKGHVYDDVKPQFEKWKSEGHELAIYSSGSVQAQKLIFGYSVAGDLTPLISQYFDTKVGGKRETQSYRNIATALNAGPQDIIFFSDISEELQAAKAVGMHAVQLCRDGQRPHPGFPSITSFSNLNPMTLLKD